MARRRRNSRLVRPRRRPRPSPHGRHHRRRAPPLPPARRPLREAGRRAGHSPDTLKVGVHALGYVAETDKQAADAFFPGYAAAFSKIGQERGWGPVTRRQFDALLGPEGALIVGARETVLKKLAHYNESLGGIARLSFQMSVAGLNHEHLTRAIRLLGEEIAPTVRVPV